MQALDVLRALGREPAAGEALLAEVRLAAGADRRLDDAAAELVRALADPEQAELRARRTVERMALVLQGSLLVRHAPPRRWPTRSARRGWPAAAAWRTGRCPPRSTWTPCWRGDCLPEAGAGPPY